jgi:cysteine desulfuration protein SufE
MAKAFDEIRANFALLDDWEDKYRYIIELGRALAPLAAGDRSDANKVRGCASQVWLATAIAAGPDGPRLTFSGDSDAHIVKGLIATLLALCNGEPAAAIAELDIEAALASLGLKEHLTPQRSNGLASMVGRIRSDARAALGRA